MRNISHRKSGGILSPWRVTGIGLALLGSVWLLLESFGIAVSFLWHLFPAAIAGSVLYGGWRIVKRTLFEE